MNPVARERLLEAMLVELEERGREGFALADVLDRSAVPEADFAAEYSGIDAYLNAVHEELAGELDRVAQRGCRLAADRAPDEGADWPAQVWGGLEALLAELSSKPALARALTRTLPSLDPVHQARYQAFVESFGPKLAPGRRAAGAEQHLPAEVEVLAIGAAEAIVFTEIASGRAEGLPAMGPSILFSLLVPFLGPARAAAEMEKARLRT